MKTKKMVKKIILSKTTIANLEHSEQAAVKGGYWKTELFGGCTSWHPVCFTMPAYKCNTELSICEPCIVTLNC